MKNLKIGFFASHNGSNVGAILENIKSGYLNAEAKIVISNNPDAGVLEIAKKNNVPALCLNAKNLPDKYTSLDEAILGTLAEHQVNLIVLAGYMKKISPAIIDVYKNRILNIHPALLPKYGGEKMYGEFVHQAVLQSDDTESGATIHLVTPEYDEGKILGQCKVPRYKNDTVATLSQRVLQFEHTLYSQVLKDIELKVIDLDN